MATTKRERQKAQRRAKLERQQRDAQRRRTIRRSVIVAVIAAAVITSAALIFSGGSSTPTTLAAPTTTTTAALSTTTSAAVSTTTTTLAPGTITQAQADAKAVAAGCPASTATRVNTLSWPKAPALTINTAKTYDATFTTTAGTFVVQLDAKNAPITTNNFIFLAQHNYYHCVIFHRVIPGFMFQGGDPTGTGTGGPGYTIADELPKTGSPTYPLYSIAMANTGQPHTGGSQFFVVTGASGETLPNSYSLFGHLISGQNVAKIINDAGSTNSSGVPPVVTHRILSITISEH
jgi:cyclophilin family peptidyl-prolyl cis-trans isomerase